MQEKNFTAFVNWVVHIPQTQITVSQKYIERNNGNLKIGLPYADYNFWSQHVIIY